MTRGAIALAILLLSTAGRAAQPSRPSAVILISIDSLRPDHLGAYGYAVPVSPRIDSFARESIVFNQAYSVATWTRPSHMSLFTSVYPQRTGAESGSGRMAADLITMAQALRGAGFRTAGFASTANLSDAFDFGRGFDVYRASNTWGEVWPVARDNERMALEWIAQRTAEPFFLFLHYYTAHYSMDPKTPLYAAPPDCLQALGASRAALQGPRAARIAMPRYEDGRLEDYDGKIGPRDRQAASKLYDAGVLCTDGLVGSFFDGLKKLGVYDGALIILLSDHGEGLFDHGLLSHGTVYDDVLHVPLIVRLPGGARAGARIGAQVRTIDVLPTVLEAAGARPDGALRAQMRGSSLWPVVDRPDPGFDVCAQTEVQNVWLHALRSPEGWKLIENLFLNVRSLYDVRSDPGESRDVFRLHPDVAGSLEERLLDCFERPRG